MSTDAFNPAILVPVYNHAEAIGITVEHLNAFGLPICLVDDGSDADCAAVLNTLANQNDDVHLVTLPENRGKGGAVKAGFEALFAKGFTHAIQVDADGQHNLDDLPTLLSHAKAAPDALVTGYPVYDDSVPKVRLYSRYLTHVWVWINTLSFHIKDTMCGFRVYPLTPVVELIRSESMGDRMDFDPEVLVRWFWRGHPVINLPTKVHYPLDGVSHFDVFKDNVLISWMHTRLFFGMLIRLPKLLAHKCKQCSS